MNQGPRGDLGLGSRTVQQTATIRGHERKELRCRILSGKVATLFRRLRSEKVALRAAPQMLLASPGAFYLLSQVGCAEWWKWQIN